MTKNKDCRIKKDLAKLFTELYSGTDCQTTFKVGEVCDMIRPLFHFKGLKSEQGDKIMELVED